MTREDWKRSARQGGPGWTPAGVLLVRAAGPGPGVADCALATDLATCSQSVSGVLGLA